MITRDAWLNAVQAIENERLTDDPNAVTMMEFCAKVGKHRATAMRLMKQLISSGKAERVRKAYRRSDGMVITVQAYRLKSDTAKRKR